MVAPQDTCSSPTAGGHFPEHQLPPSARPRLGSSHAPIASRARGLDWLYLLNHAKIE